MCRVYFDHSIDIVCLDHGGAEFGIEDACHCGNMCAERGYEDNEGLADVEDPVISGLIRGRVSCA